MSHFQDLLTQIEQAYQRAGWLESPLRGLNELELPCPELDLTGNGKLWVRAAWPTSQIMGISSGVCHWARLSGYRPLRFAQLILQKISDACTLVPGIQSPDIELPVPGKGYHSISTECRQVKNFTSSSSILWHFELELDKEWQHNTTLHESVELGHYMMVINANLQIVEIEGNGLEIMGVEKESLIGQHLLPILANDRDVAIRIIDGLRRGEMGSFTTVYGNYEIDCLSFPRLDESGMFCGAVGFQTVKSTNVKQATHQVPSFHGMFQQLLQEQPIPFLLLDESGHITSCSLSAAEVLGCEVASLVGIDFGSIIRDDDSENLLEKWQLQLKDQTTFSMPFLPVSINDSELWLDTRAVFLGEKWGKSIVLQVADVTDRWHADQKIMRTEALLQTILDEAGTSIVVTDISMKKIKLANNYFFEMFGFRDVEHAQEFLMDIDGYEDDNQIRKTDSLIRKKLQRDGFWDGVLQMDVSGRSLIYHSAMKVFDWLGTKYVLSMHTDMSQVAELQQKVSRTERQFEAIFNVSATPMIVYDATTLDIILVNMAVEKLYGFTVAELIGSSIVSFWSDHQRAEILTLLSYSSLKNETEVSFRTSHISKTNETIEIVANATLLPHDLFERDAVVITFLDVTKSAHLTRELNEQKDFLRAVLDRIPYPIFLKDKDLRYLIVNKKFEEDSGFTQSHIMGLTDSELFGEGEIVDFYNETDIKAFKDQMIDYEHEDIVKGSKRYSFTMKRKVDIPGQPGSLLGVSSDITERKLAELRVKERERLFTSLFDSSADALFLVDRKTDLIIDCNKAAMIMFATDRKADLIGIRGLSLHVEAPSEQRVEQIYNSLEEDDTYTTEVLYKRFDGTVFWGSLAVKPLIGNDGNILGRVTDITSTKNLFSRIEDSLKEKEILLREIHHRVKNNLAVIMSLLSLQSLHSPDPAVREVFNEAMSRIRGMALLHEELYRNSNLSRIDFRAYLQNLGMQVIRSFSTQRPVQLFVEGDFVGLDIIKAVPTGLILNELITNSCKHAFTGRDKGVINIKLSVSDDDVAIAYSDNGIGKQRSVSAKGGVSLGHILVAELSKQLKADYREMYADELGGGYAIYLSFQL